MSSGSGPEHKPRVVLAPLDGVLLDLSPDEHHREVAATHPVLLAVAMFPRPP